MTDSFSILIVITVCIVVSVLDFGKYFKLDLEKGISIAFQDLSESLGKSFGKSPGSYQEETFRDSKVLQQGPKPRVPLRVLEKQKSFSEGVEREVKSEARQLSEALALLKEKRVKSGVAFLFADPLFGIGGPFWFPGSQMEALRMLERVSPYCFNAPWPFDVAGFLSNVEAFSAAGSYAYNLNHGDMFNYDNENEDDDDPFFYEKDPTFQDLKADFCARFEKTHSWTFLEFCISAMCKLLCSEGSPIIGKKIDALLTNIPGWFREFYTGDPGFPLSSTKGLAKAYRDLGFEALKEVKLEGIKKTHAIRDWSEVIPFLFSELGLEGHNTAAEVYALLKRNPFLEDPFSFDAFKRAILFELNKEKPFTFGGLFLPPLEKTLRKSETLKDNTSERIFFGLSLVFDLLNVPNLESAYVLTYGTWETCTLLVEKAELDLPSESLKLASNSKQALENDA